MLILTEITNNPHIIHLLHQNYNGWNKVVSVHQYVKISIIIIMIFLILSLFFLKKINHKNKIPYFIIFKTFMFLVLISGGLEFFQSMTHVQNTGAHKFAVVVESGYLRKYRYNGNFSKIHIQAIKPTIQELSKLKGQRYRMNKLQQQIIKTSYHKTHTKNVQHYVADVKKYRKLEKKYHKAKINYNNNIRDIKYVVNNKPPRFVF